MKESIERAKKYITEKVEITPEIGLILGSGLGFVADDIENAVLLEYTEIPDFPHSTAPGHEGKLVFGKLKGKNVVALKGRFHLYEGWNPETIKFVIYVLKSLGVKKLLITNAAGAINKSYNPGEIIIVKDLINFQFKNPLKGQNLEEYGPRFPDMSSAVDLEWASKLKEKVRKLREGVYIAVLGPSYETPAEIKAFRKLGADLVGMSTVPEVIVANHCGIKCLVLSCVTNMAAGVLETPLSHQEVMEVAKKVKEEFSKIVFHALEVL
ncbi:purine-nucleoside phosphorylase [Thermosipho ferrireducens]|uniref:Purine nucleoside phosphorylase n=1 Tax=Thermosipho ferrireducens TaxID=2571116 RepID=A0ABX7S5J5_9BACT|nr:purine-nucleoside phosphorylase [Thermosipho ferrireducens]QTA37819.1 purine-nucleoside phosphorylase [Thermosipho ferrireducens]